MGEDGAWPKLKNIGFGVKDHDAGDVAREQIRGELHAPKRAHRVVLARGDVSAQGLGKGRLATAGIVFEKHMPVGQQGRNDKINDVIAPHDVVLHTLAKKRYGLSGLFKTHGWPLFS